MQVLTYTTNDEQIYTDNKSPKICGKSNNLLPSNFITAKKRPCGKKSRFQSHSFVTLTLLINMNFEANSCDRLRYLMEFE